MEPWNNCGEYEVKGEGPAEGEGKSEIENEGEDESEGEIVIEVNKAEKMSVHCYCTMVKWSG